MKIAHVLPALTKGGGERVAAELANAAARQGHEVTMVVAHPVDPSLLQHSLHPAISVLFASPHANKYSSLLPWLWKHRQWLKSQDILHCHLTYGAFFGTAAYWLKKLWGSKKPVVVETYHAVGMPIPAYHQWLHAKMATQRDALVLMAEDRYWKNFVRKHPGLQTLVIPNGTSIADREVSEAEKAVYKKELAIPDTCRYIVGTIGRLHPERQPLRYIPIFAEVAKAAGPDVHFVMAGDGAEMENVKDAIRHHGLQGRVHLPGLVRDTTVPFSIFDIYISLNVGPITGISILEATLHGLPTVAIQVLKDYKAGSNDWVWSSTNDSATAQKIISLLQDPSARYALAEEQFQYARRHHSIEAMATAYDKLYASFFQERVKEKVGFKKIL